MRHDQTASRDLSSKPVPHIKLGHGSRRVAAGEHTQSASPLPTCNAKANLITSNAANVWTENLPHVKQSKQQALVEQQHLQHRKALERRQQLQEQRCGACRRASTWRELQSVSSRTCHHCNCHNLCTH